ncbi:MAG TPA: uracil-DNA glycosylase family protein [Gemmatimonas sp.]|uniref:uracil-DNA glycosylase family protein n=1 Tax=Gemmatimonas sp. TaxID=1962908 RepID=UPI002ED99104
MDARDRLRRYLEQRRELGESEYVLDGLSVDSVLDIVGAKSTSPARRPAADSGASRGAVAGSSRAPTPAAPPSDYQVSDERGGAEGSPPVQDFAPPPPAPRFDADTSADWRTALRGLDPSAAQKPAAKADRAPTSSNPEAARADAAPSAAERSKGSAAPAGNPAQLPAWLEALGLPAGLEAGATSASLAPEVALLPSLEALTQHVASCQRCALHASAKNPVPGEGNPTADFLCVGEAPGANEDAQGRPFVGDAGQLLTKILGAIQLTRESVYICNVLKHRPPGNRDPLPDEVLACQPYLLRQVELVRPKVILALGRFAAQTLLQTTTSISALRGRIHRFHGVPLIVTYHPAALLRNESWKRPTWEDVKLARRVLDAALAANGEAGGTSTLESR